MKRFKKGFTLAEVLITLAIIGVVAAISIPSVISNSQQQEFKTGLRKAVSVLNSAITMNIAIDGESPYDNANLYGYLMRHMAVIKSTIKLDYTITYKGAGIYPNAVFYTTDGMRFELRRGGSQWKYPLYEDPSIMLCTKALAGNFNIEESCGGCGSYGLNNNSDETTKTPCMITVDVNGDRKPNPANVNCNEGECLQQNTYKAGDPLGLKLTDMFTIMITDKQAIPYGVAAQRAMYQAQSKK